MVFEGLYVFGINNSSYAYSQLKLSIIVEMLNINSCFALLFHRLHLLVANMR